MMTFTELQEYNQNRWLNQVSIIVPDIHKAVENWVKYMKVGPFTIIEYSNENASYYEYDGKPVTVPFKCYVALAYCKGFEVELIQPVYGPSSYNEFLKKTGGGIHHIKFTSETNEALQATDEEFTDMGLKRIQVGELGENKHVYFDTTKELFCMVEIGNNLGPGPELPLEKLKVEFFPAMP